MSRAFLDRNSQNDANSNDKKPSQPKVDYQAQMKRLDMNINNPGWNTTDISPAQMFAEEEEERQAKAKDEEELQLKPGEEEELQKKEGSGNPGTKTNMPNDVQSKMENSFGEDFSDVNIHKDSENAPSLGALAYTQGNDVHFAPGQYDPSSQKGQELLGHELSHVVQQREGRVKPTTQGKGMPVNTDERLEKEADEQGKQAAQGKMADVKGRGSGVQRQEGDDENKTIDITALDWFKDITISDVPYLGAIYKLHTSEDGKRRAYDIRYIVAPTKNQWKEILKYGDQFYYRYIHGFLEACNSDRWKAEGSEKILEADINGNGVIRTDYYHAENPTSITTKQKADFLEALYAVGGNEKDVNMPKSGFLNPAAPQWTKTYSKLGIFIANNQNLLVERLAKENRILSSEGIQNVASLGIDAESPLAPEMIANAFASAVATARCMIEKIAVEMSKEIDPSTPVDIDLTFYDHVDKYGIIIDEALKGYDAELKNIADRSKALFELAWSLVPFGKALDKVSNEVVKHFAKVAIEQAKTKLSNEIGKIPSNGLSTKNEFASQFRVVVGKLTEDLNNLVGSNLPSSVVTSNVNSFIETF